MDNRSKVNVTLISPELEFVTSRSSGAGGQNVNKVNSKVTLNWSVVTSRFLTDEERNTILHRLKSRITSEGLLQLSSQESRSQGQNKELVLQKLDELLVKAFQKKKARKATKPTKASVNKRIEEKKRHSEKKKNRRVE